MPDEESVPVGDIVFDRVPVEQAEVDAVAEFVPVDVTVIVMHAVLERLAVLHPLRLMEGELDVVEVIVGVTFVVRDGV